MVDRDTQDDRAQDPPGQAADVPLLYETFSFQLSTQMLYKFGLPSWRKQSSQICPMHTRSIMRTRRPAGNSCYYHYTGAQNYDPEVYLLNKHMFLILKESMYCNPQNWRLIGADPRRLLCNCWFDGPSRLDHNSMGQNTQSDLSTPLETHAPPLDHLLASYQIVTIHYQDVLQTVTKPCGCQRPICYCCADYD
jgi:hypothetical protein